MSATSQLEELVAIADAAYLLARAEVYDVLPQATRITREILTPRQREVFDGLVGAESDLANFRHHRLFAA
jgi:hypothetical protein